MDIRSWKKIVLQWVTECEFTERNYFNIEQSDIEAFYRKFCEHHKTGFSPGLDHSSLTAFLQDYYPKFEPHLDDESALSSSDYIYVYSLLLHFSCVKYPQAYFHEICQKLSPQYQQCIAFFFKELLDCPSISKENLRHAIANVAATLCSPQRNEISGNNSGDLSAFSNLPRLESSPTKTPTRPTVGNQRISPSTPKTFLLEERTRELYNLRAQLETERYEKGLLEVQIKQNEDKILKLNQDHRKLQQQIQDLKNDILTRNAEGTPSVKSDSEDRQMKRRLCKEIAQKEQEISKYVDMSNALKEDKNLIQEKLLYAEKKIILCMDRIKELDYKVDELTTELEQKNEAIKYLHHHKLELEQFISETRSASSNSKPDFNTSVECLDMSFSRVTSSSSSAGSPENLGCSVVDLQLREKESENLQLKEQLSALRVNNTRLAKLIQQLSFKLSQEYHLHIENAAVNEEGQVDPTEHFMIYADCADKLGKWYKNEKNKAKKLQEDAQLAQQRNAELKKKIEKFEQEMSTMRHNMQQVEDMNEDLERSKKELLEKVAQFELEIKTLSEQKFRLVTQLDTLTNEYDQHKDNCRAHQIDFTLLIEKLQAEVVARNKENTEMNKNNAEMSKSQDKFKVETETWRTKFETLQEKFLMKTAEYETELNLLNDKATKQNAELNDHQTKSQIVKEKHEKLLVQYEAMKRNTRESDDHLDAMRNQLAVKEMEMSKLGAEIDEVRKLNTELEDHINTLMTQNKMEKQNSDITINMRDECIRRIESEMSQLQLLLKETGNELESKQNELKNSLEELQVIFNRVEAMYSLLNISMTSSALSVHVTELVDKVKDLVEYKKDAAIKIECLEFSNVESNMKVQEVEEQVQKALQEKVNYSRKIAECESEMKALEKEESSCIEKMEKELQNKADELAHSLFEQEKTLHELESALKISNERNSNKERELLVVIKEHNDTMRKLEQLQTEHAELRQRYMTKMHNCESKIDQFLEDNIKLAIEINSFRTEYATTGRRLKETDEALNELADQLQEENINKEELRVKLETSEEQLINAESKLERLLEENSRMMQELHLLFEKQTTKLQNAEEQVAALEHLKCEQMHTIVELKEKVERVLEEKERMMEDAAEYASQIQREQFEKSALLKSLEKTADQLKKAVDDKEQHTHTLEGRCANLESKLKDIDEMNIQLKAEVMDKTAELHTISEEHQQERDNWQSKISELMRKLTEQSIELEANDISIIEIMAILDNNTNFFSADMNNQEVKNLFNVEDSKNESIMNQFRKALNRFMFNVSQLQAQHAGGELKFKQLCDEMDMMRKEKNSLSDEIMHNKKEIMELQEMLAEEAKAIENQFANEVERLNNDLQNLEHINDKLTGENATLQLKLAGLEEDVANAKFGVNLLNDAKMRLTEDHKFKSELIDKLKLEERKLNESLRDKQMEIEKLHDKIAQLEKQLKQRSMKVSTTEKDLKAANEKIVKTEGRLQKVEKQLSSTQSELKEMHDRCRLQQTANQTLETELTHKSKESLELQSRISDLSTLRLHLEEQFGSTTQKLDDSIAVKLATESKYEQLNSQFQQLIRDYDVSKLQLQSALADVERLSGEMETQKSEKLQLVDELKESKSELQRANENVSQLIQQIASIRLEKEAVVDVNQLLRKQLDESGKYQSSSETKLKSIIEGSQALERKLLSAENELKSIRAHLQKSETDTEKLSAENKKLRDTQEACNKRIEKMALKLGDSQARSAKCERDNEKLSKVLEAKSATAEALQRDKDLLQSEVKVLKERLSKTERANDQLNVKVQTFEKANAALEEAKKKLEFSEIDSKSKLNKLEKMREANEEKIRKLDNALNNSEHANVRLNLEIGALNSQLQEVKNTASAEHVGQVEEITRTLNESKQQVRKFEELSHKLEMEVEELREQNVAIGEKLAKVSVALKISQENCEDQAHEMQLLRTDLLTLREQKVQIEQEHAVTCAKLNDMEGLSEQLAADKKELVFELEAKVARLKTELETKTNEVAQLRNEIDSLRLEKHEQVEVAISAATAEIKELRTRLTAAENVFEKEQIDAAQLRLDNQILQAKYREAKQRALDESTTREERIKENRLELEGKLEKMKNKMKTLYTEEKTKVKTKHEREIANIKSDLDVLKAQNAKYEEHTRKLSSQIVRLNDRILEEQKQNAMLSTKLKHLEDHEPQQFKRPASLRVSSASAATSVPASSTNLGGNLAMEDEEGEVFNNTYLTDLKSGRLPDYMSRDIGAEELQYRNSLLPPHLKSTYAAQYDHDLGEDELKDGPHSLDDSLSVLLSTTGGCVRKKVSGATHYKRPGPPTPSKNGGRLSFGGISSEPPREILRETHDANGPASCSSKTPARFGFFSSRFSMGNTRDEQKNFVQMQLRQAGDAVCTSTPRKSRSYIDKVYLMGQMLRCLRPALLTPSPLDGEAALPLNDNALPPDVSIIETPVSTQVRVASAASPHRVRPERSVRGVGVRAMRNSLWMRRHLARHLHEMKHTPTSQVRGDADGQETTVTAQSQCTATRSTPPTGSAGGMIAALQRRLRRRRKRERGVRPSLNLRGNIFAIYRTPNCQNVVLRDLNRRKARKQRVDIFNQYRMLQSPKGEKIPLSASEVSTSACNATFGLQLTNETEDEADGYIDESDDDDEIYFMEDENAHIVELDEDNSRDFENESAGRTGINVLLADTLVKKDVVTSHELLQFDKQAVAVVPTKKGQVFPERQGDSEHFEKLLIETESVAPFVVRRMQFNCSRNPDAAESAGEKANSSYWRSSLDMPSSSALVACSTAIGAATPIRSTGTAAAHLSRTIYGGSIIHNRRIPHVNTTFVRKSSIYVKNNDMDTFDDIILVTNQTITLLDLLRMWRQMDASTRALVAFALLASATSIVGILLKFYGDFLYGLPL